MASTDFTEDDVARYWDENADVWADHVRKGWDAYREHLNNPAFLRFIGDLSGKTVLDAGCGEGYNTRLLARAGARMTGIDIAARLIELARSEEAKEPLGIAYEVASFGDLYGFDDASFDSVVSFMALMDSPNFEDAVRELYRVVRPGGELVFSMIHPCFLTAGYGWIGDEEDDSLRLTVSGYFDTQPRLEYWRFSKAPIPEETPPFAVPRFPKTLSEYVNELVQNGFVLRQIEEPRPSPEDVRTHPWLSRWREHAAIFIYIRARKPLAG